MSVRKLFCCTLLILGSTSFAFSQTYPSKPVRVIVGYAPGGSIDTTARIFAPKISEYMGQQFVVENRAGAASNIAGEFVARAAPDGHILLWSSGPALGTNMAFYQKMTFNPLKDFSPIALLVYQANGFVVHPRVPAKTVKEFIVLAKSRPGQLNYGYAGTGSSQHMTAELFSKMTGVKMEGVAYKGGGPAMVDLIGGQIDLLFSPLPEVIPFVQAGKVRPIAVTGPKRSPALPDLPTIGESVPGFAFEGFIGVVGPANMPQEVVARLNAAYNKALQDTEVRKRLLDLGLGIGGGTPEQLHAHMKEQTAQMIKIAKEAGLKPLD